MTDSITAESIARGLDKGPRAGNGWSACCPAHDDSNPSLSLTDDSDKALVHCHAGCAQAEVIEALRGRGLWPERRNGSDSVPVPDPIRGNGNARGELCRYPYYRLDGMLHLDVCMYRDSVTGKKVGRKPWREPEGVKGPHPLYRVREIAERPGDPVLVVEGERTVEVAAETFPEYVVTTSCGGGNQEGHTNWMPVAGRAVVIWPDNDSTGIQYAEKVPELARKAGAAGVRIVELPAALPAKWDLADPSPPGVDVRATLDARAELKSIRLDERLAMPDPVIEWAVAETLPVVGSSVLGGGKAVGKSMLARARRRRRAFGSPGAPRPGRGCTSRMRTVCRR